MNTVRSSGKSIGDSLASIWRGIGQGRGPNRGAAWGVMILGALLAFEIFNFSTTQFALQDVLGDLAFAGLPWATVLAIAFCSIDFAGIARIFTPQQGGDEPAEVWYLFGAWLLAAAFNATLTWWGVSIAIVNHGNSGSAQVFGGQALTRVVPVFVAVMVWLIRVLIIGTFSVSGDKLFSTARPRSREPQSDYGTASGRPGTAQAASFAIASRIRPSQRPSMRPSSPPAHHAVEPTYQTLALEAQPHEGPLGQPQGRIQ